MSGFPVPSGTLVQAGSPNKNTLATAGTLLFGTNVTGDTQDRFTVGADGTLSWGPGNGPIDNTLKRNNLNSIATSANLYAVSQVAARLGQVDQVNIGNTGPAAQSGISFQAGEAGSNLYRSAAGTLKIDGVLTIGGHNINISTFTFGDGLLAGAAAPSGANTVAYGTGAPANASGANGDIYFRTDGGALTTIYQRRAGAWVGIV